MIRKVLIANRGEIAVRIIRACKEMNIRTVAVYSEIDRNSLHVRLADEAICIGPASANKSYLNIHNILEAACLTGADSIHPGYGFLSENAFFAKLCNESNIKFIGPNYEVIELMGNKINSKYLMEKSGVPVIPGSNGKITNIEDLKKESKKIGYPVILKASAGGGGKGIRIVRNEDELENLYNIVKQEAKLAFKNDDVYLEKYIENPRHVEVQVLADEHGNVVHLGERDCSIQRNNQKMIEEAPCNILDDNIRKKLGEAAVKAVKASNYTNAGTIEFLLDKDKNFYFMEMNTRLQVEHPVTEFITDIDIVKEQIRIASGEKLKYNQKNIKFSGHSIECRINAENPNFNFRPSPGKINGLLLPGGNGIRIDSFVYAGYTIPSNYDSMIAKLIVKGSNRKEAISKMKSALEELVIDGVETNVDYLLKILDNKDYIDGNIDISFMVK